MALDPMERCPFQPRSGLRGAWRTNDHDQPDRARANRDRRVGLAVREARRSAPAQLLGAPSTAPTSKCWQTYGADRHYVSLGNYTDRGILVMCANKTVLDGRGDPESPRPTPRPSAWGHLGSSDTTGWSDVASITRCRGTSPTRGGKSKHRDGDRVSSMRRSVPPRGCVPRGREEKAASLGVIRFGSGKTSQGAPR